ncbi:MAG: ATP-binding cassette domain-containing protein, partial [Pseudomonadota bacterium]|nr:ATP-binding cassette domain-containing protein [Pseudomonadota bacterium]
QICLDGANLRKLECRTLRKAIAVVPQEPFLFSGTLLENLKFGHPQAQSADIERVLKQAQLATTVATLPQGVETVIGEKGVMLSGGQKQRVALARAFLKNAPIMILDDPISQVDMETAAALTAVIEQLATERTVIVTSHRFSVFRNAERIFVLKDGVLIAQGSHADLINHNPYYAGAEAMQAVISG